MRNAFHRQRVPIALAAGLALWAASELPLAAAEPIRLVRNDVAGVWDFDTPVMAGSIRADGNYHGVARLIDKRSGRQLLDARYSALNLFKLMAVNLGMGTPRDMPREVRATDTAVEISWGPTPQHQGAITARYVVSAPDTIDLRLALRATGTYAGYELLLPSYFDRTLRPHLFLKRRAIGDQEPELDLVVPAFSEVYRGCSLVFPRDAHAARRPLDGRWNRTEHQADVAPFFPLRHYGHPLVYLTDADRTLAVALMMRRDACSAISARYFTEREEERATTYTAVDFLVFGDDLNPGDTRAADVRLVLTPLDAEQSQPLAIYKKFLADLAPPETP